MIFKIQRDWLFLTVNVAKCKTIKLVLIYRWREIFNKQKKKKKIIKDEQWFERVASWKQTLVRQSSCSTAGIIRIWRMQNRQWRARVKLCMPRINGPQYANVYKVSGTFCQPLFSGLKTRPRAGISNFSISVPFRPCNVSRNQAKIPPPRPPRRLPIADSFLANQSAIFRVFFLSEMKF